MTDEEKKAIEKIEDFLTTNIIISISTDDTADSEELKAFISKNEFKAIEYIASVFLKQSKEIEELNKENTRQHELIGNIHQKWEDKIRAKIEELKEGIKRDMINYDKTEDASWKLAIHRSMAQKIEIKKVLQLLLEKE